MKGPGVARASRRRISIAVASVVALGLAVTSLTAVALVGRTADPAAAFTPGENGQPTSGNHTDLKGRADDVTFTFQTNATLTCTQDGTATSFSFKLDYTISGAQLPSGAHVIVYLSPNNGAVNNNADANSDGTVTPAEEAAYISAVQSNEASVPMAGLSGSGTLTFNLSVTTPFVLNGGGVLGVIADDIDFSEWNTKTNSLNCSETSTPTPTPTRSPTATPRAPPPRSPRS